MLRRLAKAARRLRGKKDPLARAREHQRRYAEITRKTKARVLRALAENPGLTPAGLARKTGTPEPVVRQFLHRWLFARGGALVTMRKGRRLALTSRGASVPEEACTQVIVTQAGNNSAICSR